MFDLDEITDFITEPTADELASLDDELLARLLAAGGTATLRVLFDGARPVWAIEAADRLLADELIELVPGGGITATVAGRKVYADMPARPLKEVGTRRFN